MRETPLVGPLSAAILSAAQRNDNPVVDVAGGEYAVGMAVTNSGKIVVAVLPMPQAECDHRAHPIRRR